MQQLEMQFIGPNDPRWLSFLQQRTEANIFHHPVWMQLLQDCYGFRPFVFAACDSGGLIHAGLPVMEVNRPLQRRRWISLPFSDHSMPLASEPEAVTRLFYLVQSLSEKPKSPSIEIRWNISGQVVQQTPAKYVLHMLHMEPGLEKVNSLIHHSHQRNVRIAQEQGVQIRHGTEPRDLKAFYALHLETRRRQGVPIQPEKYFYLLNDILLKQGFGFISLAYRGSQCLAGAIFLNFNHTLTYKYGASTQPGLPFRPNHLIFWEAIQWGCENGYLCLDFGRSDCSNDGLRLFKSRWGAEEIPLSYLRLPPETRPSGQEDLLFSALQGLIRIAPSWVCKIGGELYYRMVA